MILVDLSVSKKYKSIFFSMFSVKFQQTIKEGIENEIFY